MAIAKMTPEEMNAAVAALRGVGRGFTNPLITPQYHKDWDMAGAIIAEEGINLLYNRQFNRWTAWITNGDDHFSASGETPLMAAMRCYLELKSSDIKNPQAD